MRIRDGNQAPDSTRQARWLRSSRSSTAKLRVCWLVGAVGVGLSLIVAWLGAWLGSFSTTIGFSASSTASGNAMLLRWSHALTTREVLVASTDHAEALARPFVDAMWDRASAQGVVPCRGPSEFVAYLRRDRRERDTAECFAQVWLDSQPRAVWRTFDDGAIRNSIGFDPEQRALWTMHIEDLSGWPFRALSSSLRVAPIAESPDGFRVALLGGLPLPSFEARWGLDAHSPPEGFGWQQAAALPFTPIWHGLLLNAIFWTIVAGVALALQRRAVALHRRLTEGRCRRCGYSVQQLPRCPECGAANPHLHDDLPVTTESRRHWL